MSWPKRRGQQILARLREYGECWATDGGWRYHLVMPLVDEHQQVVVVLADQRLHVVTRLPWEKDGFTVKADDVRGQPLLRLPEGRFLASVAERHRRLAFRAEGS